jgi:hypothetical protein
MREFTALSEGPLWNMGGAYVTGLLLYSAGSAAVMMPAVAILGTAIEHHKEHAQ